MVPTQRAYGNILRVRKTDAFAWAKLILKKTFLNFFKFRYTNYG